jgi:hypothetical protein
MGVINDVYFALTKPFTALGNARFGTKLLRTGISAEARIDGIKTTRTESTSNQRVWIFAVTVRPGAADEFRAGFQQNLPGGHARQRVHLGLVIPVRHDESRRKAVIDWPGMLASWGKATGFDTPDGWRPVAAVPADGIEDHTQRPPRGTRADATVVSVTPRPTAFGSYDLRPDVVLALPDGRQLRVEKLEPPDYAFYLLAPGVVLPVGVRDGDRVEVDWVAAAQGYARTPPAATFDFATGPSRRRLGRRARRDGPPRGHLFRGRRARRGRVGGVRAQQSRGRVDSAALGSRGSARG